MQTENISSEINKYINNKNTSFTQQFNLFKTNDSKDKFGSTNYVVNKTEITSGDIYPHNQFDLLKNKDINKLYNTSAANSNRRDNSIVIKDYYSDITGQYAKSKTEAKAFFEPFKNETALAGNTKIVDSISLDRYSQALTIKNNEFPTNTYIRPEKLDGTPITEQIRVMDKSLEELRGAGVNSVRLDPNGRNNMTALKGEGMSVNPDTINITKFKIKPYRDQDTIDLLRTTGSLLKPEWRSKVKEPATNRTISAEVIGPAKSNISKEEYRNEMPANPTIKEDLIINSYIPPSYNNVSKNEYRNNLPAKPTLKEDLIPNTYIPPSYNNVNMNEYRNNMPAKPTIKEDFIENNHILNFKTIVNKPIYNNNMSANPTIKEQFVENNNILNFKTIVDKPVYNNNHPTNPTLRDEVNQFDGPSYNLNQSRVYNNNMAANPTLRETTENNNFNGPSNYQTKSFVVENNMPANPTLRDEINKYDGTNYSATRSIVLENNMAANPTLREITEANEYTGASVYSTMGIVYENKQNANPTMRDDKNKYSGPSYKEGIYKKNTDITRSGVIEEVLAKDYMGISKHVVANGESRLITENFINNKSIENSIDLTKREVIGGTDQIAAGKDNIGVFSTNMKRDTTNNYKRHRVNVVGTNNVLELTDNTRGKLLLEQRSAINSNINKTLEENPYVNNMVHYSLSQDDKLAQTTYLNARPIDESVNKK